MSSAVDEGTEVWPSAPGVHGPTTPKMAMTVGTAADYMAAQGTSLQTGEPVQVQDYWESECRVAWSPP